MLLHNYEYVPGSTVHPKLAQRERVPVPAPQIREWAGVPRNGQFATLAKEIEDFYDPTARDVAVRYVREFPHVSYYGSTLLLVGAQGTAKAREWMACAVVNEITMRFCEVYDVTSRWLSPSSVKGMLAMNRTDAVTPMRARYMDTKLLFLAEPQIAKPDSEIADFFADVLSHRWHQQLPTILTISTMSMPTPETIWSALGQRLTPYTVEMLRDTALDYIAYF